MKKRFWILLLIAALLLLPHAASANAPAPDPWELSVYLLDVPEGTTVTAFFLQEDGTLRQGETYTSSGAKSWKIGVWFKEDEKQFYLTILAPDGAETRTNAVAIEPYGSYTVDCKTNVLAAGKPSGSDSCLGGLAGVCLGCGKMLLWHAFVTLIVPLAVTLLVEWLAALCFGIRPVKYVFVINAITNPIMNVLLLLASIMLYFGHIGYWAALAVLEIAVVLIEYWYYIRNYPDIRRGKLLAFSITANVLSLLLGGLLQYLLL